MEYSQSSPRPENNSISLSLCPSPAILFFLPSAYTLVLFTALPGNALSLWVFFKCISTISPTHIYLSHLSISNLLLSLTTPFLAAYYAQSEVWPLSGILCQLVLHLITPVVHININISVMILTWVALSRFASLIQHTHSSRPSTCKTLLPLSFFNCLTRTSIATKVCATMWVLVVGGTLPVTVYYSVKEAALVSKDEGGREEVCYNPEVEIGGVLSAAFQVPVLTLFFVFYLLMLLTYIVVLKHIRRSRRSTNFTHSQRLLGRVLRNIVAIQVVFSVCLLPYHIFKSIFISLVHDEHQQTVPSSTRSCHPYSILIELKSGLMLLTALRSSADPLLYFLLDKTFRYQILKLLGSNRGYRSRKQFWTITGNANEGARQLRDVDVATTISL